MSAEAVESVAPQPFARARVAVVGTGFAGLGMAIQLKRAGIKDFVVLEKADEVGGTWRDNTYPGAACDVPSHLYSFSFALNPDWPESFSAQPDILAYLRRCADDFGVRPFIRFGCEVTESAWDDDAQVWRLQTSRGEVVADVLVAGTGALHIPAVPDIPGVEHFQGTTFHTAAWNHEHDLAGERVAVIGTGASSIQVVPQIQPVAGHLDVYQRTPPWIIPRLNRAISDREKRLFRRFPAAQRVVRNAIYWGHEAYAIGFTRRIKLLKYAQKMAYAHLARQVPDRELRRKLTPDYTMGCKRVLISSDYYPALTKPNVDVVTSGIREIRAHSIVTADGVEHPTDTIVFGTGFHVTDFPAAQHIRGRGGRVLADDWRDGMSAYAGLTINGFPNLFLMTGPNTGLGHTSMVIMIEAQIGYVVDALRTMTRDGIAAIQPTAQAQQRWTDDVQRRMDGTVWTAGGCASWYLDEHGRNTTLWPDFTVTYRYRLRRFDPAAYHLEPLAQAISASREAISAASSG